MSLAGAGNESARNVSQCLRIMFVRNTLETEDGINAPRPMNKNKRRWRVLPIGMEHFVTKGLCYNGGPPPSF